MRVLKATKHGRIAIRSGEINWVILDIGIGYVVGFRPPVAVFLNCPVDYIRIALDNIIFADEGGNRQRLSFSIHRLHLIGIWLIRIEQETSGR
jgi:hypothetical protein